MEAILIDCVQNSLRHLMYRNAIFMCERLCAEFPSETNLQLLAGCYLHNDQAYSAYHILKGTQMAQSRYLFAISCFEMDLLNEAEAALCPANEPVAEVPNGAAGHYLLGLIYRYTDRRKSAIHHFKQALSIDPLLWAAYEELCVLGAAEEATSVFGEVAALCIQKQHLNHGLAYQNSQASSDDRNFGSEDIGPRGMRHMNANNTRDVPGNYHGAVMTGGAASQPLNGGPASTSFYNTPSPMAAQDYVKRQTRFVSHQPAKLIISTIEAVAESMGLKVHTRYYKMDELVHKAKLYRTNWHFFHFWKDYIFLYRCIWKILE